MRLLLNAHRGGIIASEAGIRFVLVPPELASKPSLHSQQQEAWGIQPNAEWLSSPGSKLSAFNQLVAVPTVMKVLLNHASTILIHIASCLPTVMRPTKANVGDRLRPDAVVACSLGQNGSWE